MITSPHFKIYRSAFSRAYSLLKPQMLFYGDGLATWYGFPDITHFEVDNRRNFEGHIPP